MVINKWVLAVIGGVVALGAAGAPLLQGGSFTIADAVQVLVPAIVLAVVGKVGIDPEAAHTIPAYVSGLGLGIVAVIPQINGALADGVLTPTEVITILVAFGNQFYHTSSVPERLGFHRT